MVKSWFWSLGATLVLVGVFGGCDAPDGDKGSLTRVQSAVTAPLFSPYVAYPFGSSPLAAAIGDLDGDGRNDIAVSVAPGSAPTDHGAVHVFLQAADGTLKPDVVYPLGDYPGPIEIGDVNGDGRADMVFVVGNGIGVMPQNASGTLDPMVSYPTLGSNWRQLKIADFNGDGRMDLAAFNVNGANNLAIFLQTATGTLASPVTYQVGAGASELRTGDVNSDGRTDLVVRMSGNGVPNLIVLLQNADGTIGPPTSYSLDGTNPNHFGLSGIALGDLDGDGRSDVVAVGSYSTNANYLARMLQSAQGTLDATAFSTFGFVRVQPFLIALANLDSQGPNDILLTHTGPALGVFRQSAPGAFSAEEFYPLPTGGIPYGPAAFVVGDVNGDGLPDVVLADDTNGLLVLRHVDNVPPTVAITAPTGGTYYPSVPIAVGWTASDNAALAGFDLSASLDGGATFSPIAGCTGLPAAARTCTWTPSGPPGAVDIRVTARDTAGNQASADTVISLVTPTLTVTGPTAGTTLFVGGSLAVTWTDNLPASATMLVELSRDGGGTFETLAAAAPNTGNFAGVSTGPGTANAEVRVSANGPATASGVSGGFSIITPALTVTSPAPAAIAYVGTPVAITWTDNLPASATVAVEVSRDGGSSFQLVAAAVPNTGSLSWMASGPDTAQALVRVTASGPAIAVAVSATFAIVTPAVTVTGPASGSVAFVGTSQTITWTDNLPSDATMLVELSRDGGNSFETLAAAAPNSGSFVWTVAGAAATTALVRVTGNEPLPTSGLGAAFSIVVPTLTVTSPSAGASWAIGTAHTISWTTNLPSTGTVDIDLSLDGGTSYTTLAATAPNSGSFAWTATGPGSASAIVRITSNGAAPASGISGLFAIINPTLAISAPTTGASWTIGTAHAITWTTNLPATDTVRIDLSRNGGTTYSSLATSAPNNGSFTWTVAGTATSSAIVRVSSNGTTAVGISGKFSLVAATVTVTSPNTAVTWLVGSVHAVTWTHNMGTGALFKIEVSRNSGSSWSLVTGAASSSGATSGSYNWTVSAPRTSTARIRVTWTTNTAVTDTSNVNFKIN
jgi:hypothetical protein